MENIALYISVPVASFRVPRAREYFETFPIPPPATVYGMLLSMIGETNRRIYEGTEIAIGLLSEPAYSVVLRTLWRVKKKESGLGLGENRRPDFQELLTDIRLTVWIKRNGENSLAEKVEKALKYPNSISRFGGLALGESTHLVDEIKLLGNSERNFCRLLLNDADGEMSLPIWADHVSSGTNWGQFSFGEIDLKINEPIPQNAWIKIQRNSIFPIKKIANNPRPNLFE